MNVFWHDVYMCVYVSSVYIYNALEIIQKMLCAKERFLAFCSHSARLYWVVLYLYDSRLDYKYKISVGCKRRAQFRFWNRRNAPQKDGWLTKIIGPTKKQPQRDRESGSERSARAWNERKKSYANDVEFDCSCTKIQLKLSTVSRTR